MEIQLLGTPGALVGGVRCKVAGRQRALLAVLALSAPRPVSTDRLVDVLWPDRAPADPANALHQRVSALRKQLDPSRRGNVLVPTGGGYALRVDDAQVDARRFEAHVARGHGLLRDGDPVAARRELGLGLGLWAGSPLEGFDDEDWARPPAQRLAELRLVAIEDRVEADLSLGAGPELVGELTDLLAEHPLRETLAGQLVRALAVAGRQADAMDVYARTCRRLAEELGVDPGQSLRDVHRQVLSQEIGQRTVVGGAGRPTAIGNLPMAHRAVVGREPAVADLCDRVRRHHLVTLTGTGGTGKTTLALEVARAFPAPRDGRWFVELDDLVSDRAVAATVAAATGIETEGLGGSGLDADTVVTALARREALLVVDGCEHVLDGVGRLVSRLLDACPGVRVLATSREPLGVPGEHCWPVPPLDVPDDHDSRLADVLAAPAVRLLLERARERDPDFTITEDTFRAAAAVVRRLDGLPLAVELAAARLTVLSLPQIEDGLRDRFTLLATRSRMVAPRHRTLRSTLDWSWDLLDEQQRKTWCALSVPPAGFDLATAEALLVVVGTGAPSVSLLADLVERSLVVAVTTQPPARYRMLETVREYGRERLAEAGLDAVVRERHAELVEEAVAACHGAGLPTEFGVDLDGLASVLDDARAVMAWSADTGDHARVQRLAGALGWLWLLRGLAAEGLYWLDRGLLSPRLVRPGEAEPSALLWASALRAHGTSADDPLPWVDMAVAAARTAADEVLASVFGAVNLAHAGRSEESARRADAAVADAERIGGWPLGFALLVRAQLRRLAGGAGPDEDAERALDLLTAARVDWARVFALDLAIDGLLARGQSRRARDLAVEGLAVCQRQRLPELEARLLAQLGTALHELGDGSAGRAHLDRAIELTAATGQGPALGYVLLTAGSLARRRGDRAEAVRHLEAALEAFGDAPSSHAGSARARTELAAITDTIGAELRSG